MICMGIRMYSIKLATTNVIGLPCICFPTKRKAYHGFLIRVGTEAEDKDRGQDIPYQQHRPSKR